MLRNDEVTERSNNGYMGLCTADDIGSKETLSKLNLAL